MFSFPKLTFWCHRVISDSVLQKEFVTSNNQSSWENFNWVSSLQLPLWWMVSTSPDPLHLLCWTHRPFSNSLETLPCLVETVSTTSGDTWRTEWSPHSRRPHAPQGREHVWHWLWKQGLHSGSLGFTIWSQNHTGCYSNSSKKKAVMFVDERLYSFFLNVGGRWHVGDSNLVDQLREQTEV